MTSTTSESQVQAAQSTPSGESAKEINFRRQEAMYQRMLDEKENRIRELQEAQKARQQQAAQEVEEEDDSEPYVDHKNLKKQLNKYDQSNKSEIQKAMEQAKAAAKDELRQELWLENNSDFYQVMELADKFAEKAPKLAENILKMPNTFERQKLVYQTIKELGIDKPEGAKGQSAIQEKINSNQRGPYYQPGGVGTAPYAGAASDFSPQGQKQAYDKLMELKKRLQY